MLREKIETYLALGSNLGDRLANLNAAQSAVASAKGFYLDRTSPTYESPAADLPDQPRFLNRVLDVQVWLTPRELLETCQGIEAKLGREVGIPKGPRVIDIDILIYGDAAVNETDLIIPHPALTRRAFFLQPLKDIAGDMVLPGAGVPLSRLLAALAPYELIPYKPTY